MRCWAAARILVRTQAAGLEQDGLRAGAWFPVEVVGPVLKRAPRELVCSRAVAVGLVLKHVPQEQVCSPAGRLAPVSEALQGGWRESPPARALEQDETRRADGLRVSV